MLADVHTLVATVLMLLLLSKKTNFKIHNLTNLKQQLWTSSIRKTAYFSLIYIIDTIMPFLL